MLNLSLDTVNCWSVDVAETDRERSWAAHDNSNNANHRWVSYLNSLCLNLFQPLANLEHDGLWPSTTALQGIWDVTTGSAITLGSHRLVMIPTEAIDASNLVVPQEWVDIPDWSGDYYVLVQINADQSELSILGYTTHQLLKQQGDYDAFDRTYNFEAEDLLHWDSFSLVYGRYSAAQTREQIEPLADLGATQANNLIERLGNPSEALPRLEIPFAQWGALLANADWRDRLFAARQGQSPVAASVPSGVVRLSRWLQQQFETDWQALELERGTARGMRNSVGEDVGVEDVEVEGVEAESTGEAIAEPTQYRIKRLTLSPQLQLDLTVGIASLENGDFWIYVKLGVATGGEDSVEPIRLRLLDEAGIAIGQASTTTMEQISLQFSASPSETFLIEVSYAASQHVEQFGL